MTITRCLICKSISSVVVLPRPFSQVQAQLQRRSGCVGLLPVTESDQDGPVELVLGAVGLGAAGVDKGVDGSQQEALLVELLQLAGQFPHRGQAECRRPTWQTAETEEKSETKVLVSMTPRRTASSE